LGGQAGCYNLVPVFDWIVRCISSKVICTQTYLTAFVSRRALRAMAQSNIPYDEKSNTTSPVPGFGNNQSELEGTSTPVKTSGMPTKGGWQGNPSILFQLIIASSLASPATSLGGPETNAKI
jgi:hypothetical protein